MSNLNCTGCDHLTEDYCSTYNASPMRDCPDFEPISLKDKLLTIGYKANFMMNIFLLILLGFLTILNLVCVIFGILLEAGYLVNIVSGLFTFGIWVTLVTFAKKGYRYRMQNGKWRDP
jgi:hypothetical protein